LRTTAQSLQTQLGPLLAELSTPGGLAQAKDLARSLTALGGRYVEGLAEGAGQALATSLVVRLGGGDEAVGQAVGGIAGGVLFNVALSYATDGAFLAAKAVLPGLVTLVTATRDAALVAEDLGRWLPQVLRGLEVAGGRLKGAVAERVQRVLDTLKPLVERLLAMVKRADKGDDPAAGASGHGSGTSSSHAPHHPDPGHDPGHGRGPNQDQEPRLEPTDSPTSLSGKCRTVADSIATRSASLLEGREADTSLANRLSQINNNAQSVARDADRLARQTSLSDAQRIAAEKPLLQKAINLDRDMDKLEQQVVEKGVVRDGKRYFPEAKLLGSAKHGVEWREGAATARSLGIPQGQFGSAVDVDFAVKEGARLGLTGAANGASVSLPTDSTCFTWNVDGTTSRVTQLFIKVYPSGKVHGYPFTP